MHKVIGFVIDRSMYHLQGELLRIWRLEQITMILVTHDVDEAIYLSDRVVVMASDPGSRALVQGGDFLRSRAPPCA